MFRRRAVVQEVRTTHVIELSDDIRQALVSLDSDIQTLNTFMAEVRDTATSILARLHGEIVAQIPEVRIEDGEEAVGVEVFADKPGLPGFMHENEPENPLPDDQRVRATPFTRAPRHVQVDWLKQVMADGQWYAAIVIARHYATDERHFRYMKHALSGRLREMHEEGLVVRRESNVKGSMFEYRLVNPERQ